MDTPEFEQSSDERKRVEMRFAHLKVHHRFERMRLRGFTGARDEFHLAATVQNLKTLANHIWRPPTVLLARGQWRQAGSRESMSSLFNDSDAQLRRKLTNRGLQSSHRGLYQRHRPICDISAHFLL